MLNKFYLCWIILVVGSWLNGCAGPAKVLMVRSDPPDAEVCIKGKAKSEYFSNHKSCVGSTPFEADKVQVVDSDGEKKVVHFKDVANDREGFYVLVSHKGYVSKSVEVPGWNHEIKLVPEAQALAPTLPLTATAVNSNADKGQLKIITEPIGALVYINDALRGNTPFSLETTPGAVRFKLELKGYENLEKLVAIEAGKILELSIKLVPSAAVPAASPTVAPAPASNTSH